MQVNLAVDVSLQPAPSLISHVPNLRTIPYNQSTINAQSHLDLESAVLFSFLELSVTRQRIPFLDLKSFPIPLPSSPPTMASVSSLDQDMRKLRLDRYTPAAANEIRSWIESMLGSRLQTGDLMDALKDGVALCKYAQSAVRLIRKLTISGWSISPSLQVSNTRSQVCPLYKWRTYPTSSAPAKCLLSIYPPTTGS